MKRLRVVDLYQGTGSATQAFLDAGHEVFGVENDPALTKTPIDARLFAKDPARYLPKEWDGKCDIVWASPDCTAYSMAGKGSEAKTRKGSVHMPRWHYAPHRTFIDARGRVRKAEIPFPFFGPRFPGDKTAREGVALVLSAFEAVRKLEPRYHWIENPMGGLKTMAFMFRRYGEPATISYCQYGDMRQKMTNLWGAWPEGFVPRAKCKNGDPCHEAAPRGAKTGTQSLDPVDRSRVPYALSDDIRRACEAAFTSGGGMRTVQRAPSTPLPNSGKRGLVRLPSSRR